MKIIQYRWILRALAALLSDNLVHNNHISDKLDEKIQERCSMRAVAASLAYNLFHKQPHK